MKGCGKQKGLLLRRLKTIAWINLLPMLLIGCSWLTPNYPTNSMIPAGLLRRNEARCIIGTYRDNLLCLDYTQIQLGLCNDSKEKIAELLGVTSQ